MSERVTKAALGRGLGALMNGTKEPPSPPSAQAPAPSPASVVGPAPKAEKLSPGMAALIRSGGAAQSDGKVRPRLPARPRGLRLIRVSLLLADVLLVGLAVFLVVKTGGLLGFTGAVLCVLAMTLGAWLFWLATSSLNAQDHSTADEEGGGD